MSAPGASASPNLGIFNDYIININNIEGLKNILPENIKTKFNGFNFSIPEKESIINIETLKQTVQNDEALQNILKKENTEFKQLEEFIDKINTLKYNSDSYKYELYLTHLRYNVILHLLSQHLFETTKSISAIEGLAKTQVSNSLKFIEQLLNSIPATEELKIPQLNTSLTELLAKLNESKNQINAQTEQIKSQLNNSIAAAKSVANGN